MELSLHSADSWLTTGQFASSDVNFLAVADTNQIRAARIAKLQPNQTTNTPQWLRLSLLASSFQQTYRMSSPLTDPTKQDSAAGLETTQAAPEKSARAALSNVFRTSFIVRNDLVSPCLTNQGLSFTGPTVFLLWNYLGLSRCVSGPVSKISFCVAGLSSSIQLRGCALDGQTVMCAFN